MNASLFYIDDHALLFAFLARALLENEPGDGMRFLEQWVKSYGRERGGRSARRCLNDGHTLSVKNYFVYSEWNDERGWNRSQIISLAPYQHYTTECGWHKSWQKHKLLEYGALYCRWVDEALVEGFNPDLQIEVGGSLASGAAQCSFTWPDHAMVEADVEEMLERRNSMQPKVTREFLYHLSHLYDVLRRVLIPSLGLEAAETIMDRGLRDYTTVFGPEKTKAVLKASKQNFFMI